MDGSINSREWYRLIVPVDSIKSRLLLGRNPIVDRVSDETQDVFKRLLRAHLNLEQS